MYFLLDAVLQTNSAVSVAEFSTDVEEDLADLPTDDHSFFRLSATLTFLECATKISN